MEERLPRKLAAILYADVAGYSRLTGDDEDATHRRLRDYLDLIAQTIDNHHGQVMHYAGDAVLAKFDAVVDALSSATSIQNELKDRNQDLPDERKVQFRVGVNLGDVIEDRGDIYGDGVNWEWGLYLGVNNLFDVDYAANVHINAFGGRYFESEPERNLYAGIHLRHLFDTYPG